MKYLVIIFIISSVSTGRSQEVIFEDSFETYNDFQISGIGNWKMKDLDGLLTYNIGTISYPNSGAPRAFTVFNATQTSPPLTSSSTVEDWTARTGVRHMVSINPSVSPFIKNDWMVSPQISLGSSGNILSFWAKACNIAFGLERFRVAISTTGTEVEDFSIISEAPYVETIQDPIWSEYTFDLDAYAGLQVYIAIICVSTSQFGFAVDDFKVSAQTLSISEYTEETYSIYPNPTNDVIFIQNEESTMPIEKIELLDLNGRLILTEEKFEESLNLSSLDQGVYFLRIYNNAQIVGAKKIIKY